MIGWAARAGDETLTEPLSSAEAVPGEAWPQGVPLAAVPADGQGVIPSGQSVGGRAQHSLMYVSWCSHQGRVLVLDSCPSLFTVLLHSDLKVDFSLKGFHFHILLVSSIGRNMDKKGL